ncbi:putative reverse transcriptase domain-containing protein [Tanacetum coccineum]
MLTNFEFSWHSGHGHLDVLHVVDELGKSNIIVVNGFSFVLTKVFKVKGPNRLELVRDLVAGHLLSLQQLVSNSSHLKRSFINRLQNVHPISIPDYTIEYVFSMMQRQFLSSIGGQEELALMCDRMFPEESDVVEKYVGGLPNMIHRSVKASKPKTMREAIKFPTKLMDKKILTITERQAENKRKFEDTSRNNQNQQQPFKRNNVAWAYTAGPGEKKPYGGSKPLCPKCKYHHDGSCAPKAQGANQRVLTCFEYGAQGHFRSDCPKLKNINQGNRAGNGNAVARAYAVGTAGTTLNSNVVTGTFLLNNRYNLILFDTGADRSFVSTAFSSLIDIILTTLDHGYDVELADAHVTTKKAEEKSKEKRLKDVSIVQDFPEVFPEDLPGIPLTRQVEFQINSIPGAALVARAPYRLAPSEMKELKPLSVPKDDDLYSDQLQGSSSLLEGRPEIKLSSTKGLAGYYRRFIEGFSKIAKPMTKLTQKKVKFNWGDKAETAFQLIKQKLCSAPILALPEGSEDFIVYCDASIKGRSSVRSEDLEALSVWDKIDYDCEIRYHPGKANVVADALSRKERNKPLRVGATIGLDLPKQILKA